MDFRISHQNRSAYKCKYHFANATKFKKPYFADKNIQMSLRQLIEEECRSLDVAVSDIVVRPDIFSAKVTIDPAQSIVAVMNRLKIAITSKLAEQYPQLPTPIFAKAPMIVTHDTSEESDLLDYMRKVKTSYRTEGGILS